MITAFLTFDLPESQRTGTAGRVCRRPERKGQVFATAPYGQSRAVDFYLRRRAGGKGALLPGGSPGEKEGRRLCESVCVRG